MSATCHVLLSSILAIAPLLMGTASCPSGGRSDPEPAGSTPPEPDARIELSLESGRRHFRHPEPVLIQVSLRGPQPVSDARVRGEITSPSGSVQTIPFTDHVLPGWTMPAGGLYLGALPSIDEDGQHTIVLRADDNGGKARIVQPFTADLPENRPRPRGSSTSAGSFRVEVETAIDVAGYAGNPAPAPLPITSLYAEVDSARCVRLSWQVPLNLGESGDYSIRHAPSSLTSEDAWARASTAADARYAAGAGETQTHVLCDLDRDRVYLAVKSTNRDGVVSAVSNDYHVVLE